MNIKVNNIYFSFYCLSGTKQQVAKKNSMSVYDRHCVSIATFFLTNGMSVKYVNKTMGQVVLLSFSTKELF